MADPRAIRRLAFQALFQLDARVPEHEDEVRLWLEGVPGFSPAQREEALSLARAAFENRDRADADALSLAPDWPTHRRPAVDRAILRLAHYEITSGRVVPAIAINEAIELAREFSTDRSPAFVNAILDRILKRTRGLDPEPLDDLDSEPDPDAPPSPESPSVEEPA